MVDICKDPLNYFKHYSHISVLWRWNARVYSKISCFETGLARMLSLQKRNIVAYEQCSHKSLYFGCCEDP